MPSINCLLSIAELQAGLKSGDWTCVDLVQAYLDRITQLGHFNALIHVQDTQILLAEAAARDHERATQSSLPALHGIPVIVKDNVCTDDMPTTAGTLALKGAQSGYNADIVNHLKNAGAIILGKANLSEMSYFMHDKNPSGWSCLGGQTLNALNACADTGGSSSGSACAAVLGLAAATIGTETSGSIICPSYYQGAVGYKPSLGVCSNAGIIPISATFDTPGPICRSVADAATIMQVIAKDDSNFSNLDKFTLQDARVGVTINHGSEINARDNAYILHKFNWLVYSQLPAQNCQVVDEVLTDQLLSENSKVLSAYPDKFTIPEVNSALEQDFVQVLQCEFKQGLDQMLPTFANIPSNVKGLKSLIEFNNQHPEALHPWAKGQSQFIASEDTLGISSSQYVAAVANVTKVAASIIDKLFAAHQLDMVLTTITGPVWPLIYSLAVMSGCPLASVPLGTHPYSESHVTFPAYTNQPGTGFSVILIGKPGTDHQLLCYAKQIEALLS